MEDPNLPEYYRSQYAQPAPLEETDPELAEHLKQIANKCHPAVRSVHASGNNRNYATWDGRLVAKRSNKDVGRNDPCPCGSGKKFKKCCSA